MFVEQIQIKYMHNYFRKYSVMKTMIMMCWLIIITIMGLVRRIDWILFAFTSLAAKCLHWLCFISDLR